jgi:hypothetical protein
MNKDQRKSWSWYRDKMSQCSTSAEKKCERYLGFLEECHSIVHGILNRPLGIDTSRPQDFAVAGLVVRAFRLAVSAINLALCGYGDATPNLNRTIMELWLRILHMGADEIAASFGFLMQGPLEQIRYLELELEHRQAEDLPTYNLHSNLNAAKENLEVLSHFASAHGLEPDLIQKKYRRLNKRDICKRFGLGKLYQTEYAFDCSHVHGADVFTSLFQSGTAGIFETGPTPLEVTPELLYDSLLYLGKVLLLASGILKDDELFSRAETLLNALDEE